VRDRRIWCTLIGVTILSAGACENGEKERAAQVMVVHDSVLTKDNAELQRQKDSLLVSVHGLFDVMNSIDSAATLAGVKKEPTGEPLKTYQEIVRMRTVKAMQRLKKVEARLRASIAKVQKIGGENEQLKTELASFRDMAASLQTQVGVQQARVDTLMRQLAQAQGRGDSLSNRTRVLGTSLDSMVVERQRVYVVVGTKDDLRKKAIVEEVGGTRFPWIVKVGSTLRPTNKPPADSLFRSFDMLAEPIIQLDPQRRYEVVSAQDLTGADLSNAKGRIFQGSIHITDPQKFWNPSSHLILRRL
jgi:cell division septum initiation protein DivIVA